ncbi:RlmE family RNA methyltransferase [Pacificimonas sp. WHA3]|uniref:Ribosomal RNA large subunit methyltransferase E n=1 Tax=Pacificimonas pallii TaxID=2827236 RepID=A0ABS6SEN1_9SPHN|nr:RlmE family RNA methyltransferase [Pacificimonas pallii]MBV7256852.1 RlmE family RNA methyltransferase [Pacificimonas pallii]
MSSGKSGIGKSGQGKTRVKTARRRTAQSTRWLQRQLDDPYVKAAKAQGFRSRAAFKLLELDEKFNLLRGVKRVVDLGAAPGGWIQVVRQKRPGAGLVGIDLLDIDPIEGATIFKMDFLDDAAPGKLIEALGGQPDLVLSDMAANTTGHRQTDHLRTMGLVEVAVDFAHRNLIPGGSFVAKVLAGGADAALVAELKRNFAAVKHVKPPASRKGSSEWYVVAQGFKGE